MTFFWGQLHRTINHCNWLEKYSSKMLLKYPRSQWVNSFLYQTYSLYISGRGRVCASIVQVSMSCFTQKVMVFAVRFSLMLASISCSTNGRVAGDIKRHDVDAACIMVMDIVYKSQIFVWKSLKHGFNSLRHDDAWANWSSLLQVTSSSSSPSSLLSSFSLSSPTSSFLSLFYYHYRCNYHHH